MSSDRHANATVISVVSPRRHKPHEPELPCSTSPRSRHGPAVPRYTETTETAHLTSPDEPFRRAYSRAYSRAYRRAYRRAFSRAPACASCTPRRHDRNERITFQSACPKAKTTSPIPSSGVTDRAVSVSARLAGWSGSSASFLPWLEARHSRRKRPVTRTPHHRRANVIVRERDEVPEICRRTESP